MVSPVLQETINYSTFKGWKPMEGISYFAYRILHCKIDIENSKLGRVEKKLGFVMD